jgi:hypothetical protein
MSARTGSVPGVISLNSNGTINTAFHAPYALDGVSSFTEDSTPARLDSSVNVNDIELDQLNDGDGDYKGAYIVIARDGGANLEDVLSIKSGLVNSVNLSVDEENGLIQLSTGEEFAKYVLDNGELKVTFTSESAIATSALVQNVMERIEYSNTSNTPPASVTLNWSFSDGNTTGAQGSGGELKALGSTIVNITAVNDMPIINNDENVTIDEDNLGAITLDTTDPEGEAITYSLVANGSTSSVQATLSGNTVTLTPATNYNGGPVNITVRATDASGGSTDKTFVVNVTPINDAPTIDMGSTNLQSERTASNADASFYIDTLSVADIEDNSSSTVTVVLSTKDSYGLLNLKTNVSGGITSSEISDNGTGTVTITSSVAKINNTLRNANGLKYSATDGKDFVASGADTLTLTITDSAGESVSASRDVYILPAKPTAHSQNYTVDEDSGALSIDISALVTDINGTTPTYTLGSGTVSASDGSGGSITSFGGDESDYSKAFTTGSLADDSAGTFHDGVFTYTPNANANGVDTFLYQFTNSGGESEVAQISIYVLPVNDNPVLEVIPNQTLTEDIQKSIILSATDVENEDITYSVTGGSVSTVEAVIEGNKLILNPAADYESSTPISFTVTATDASGGTHQQTFTATVAGVPDAPRITTIANQTITEDTPSKITLNAYDPDGTAISYSLVDAGSDTTVKATLSGNELTLTPALNYSGGNVNITVRVTDASGEYTDESFAVTVTEVNDAPILDPIMSQVMTEDTPTTITLSSTDVENDAITYSVTGGSSNSITATIVGNQLTLTPADNFYTNIPIEFTVTATDIHGDRDTKTFSAIVNAVNDAPIITPIADQVLTEDSSKVIDLSVVDPENNSYTLDISGGSSDTVSARIVGNQLILEPAQDYNTSTPISYTITATDGLGAVSTQVLNLTVSPVNDAPISSMSGTYEVERTESNPYASVEISGLSVSDIDDSSVTVVISTKDVGAGDYYGTLSIKTDVAGGISASEVADNGTGIITITSTVSKINATLSAIEGLMYQPDNGKDFVANGADEITITTTDSSGASHSQSRNLYVIPAKPTANSYNYIINEDEPQYTIDLAQLVEDLNQTSPNFVLGANSAPNEVSESDGSGGVLSSTYSEGSFSQALDYGTLADDSAGTFDDGIFTYTADANAHGVDTFLYQYSSSGESSEIAQVSIYLLPVNDAPELANIADKTYDENVVNDTPQLIGSTIGYSDIDNEDLAGGMLTISGLRATEIISISSQDVSSSGNIQLDGTNLQVSDGTDWTTFGTWSGGNGGDVRVDFNSNTTPDVVSAMMKLVTYQSLSQLGESTHALDIKITDGDGLDTGTQSLNITVTSQNDAPDITEIEDRLINQGELLILNYSATDAEGDHITYSISGGSSSTLTATIQGGTITFVQAMGYSGGATEFTLTATDANGDSTDEVFTINVNQAPVVDNPIPNQIFTGSGDWTFAFDANTFSDPESEGITYSANLSDETPLPDWLSFDATTREFSGNPPADVSKLYISVNATDPRGKATTDTFKVTFVATNDTPTVDNALSDQSHDGAGNWKYVIPADAFGDADGDNLTYKAMQSNNRSLPRWLTFDASSRTFEGNPPNGISTLGLKVVATDEYNSSVSDTFVLTITNANDTPIANNVALSETINQGGKIDKDISAIFSDLDYGDILTYSATNLPKGLSIDIRNGILSGSVLESGEFEIIIKATDGKGANAIKVYSLKVLAPATATPTTSNDTPTDTTPTHEDGGFGRGGKGGFGRGIFGGHRGAKDILSTVLGAKENTSDQKLDHESIKEIIKTEKFDEKVEAKEHTETPKAKESVKVAEPISRFDPTVVVADLNVDVGNDGVVKFAQNSVSQVDTIGMTIENIDYKDEYIEIKIVDTHMNQEYQVTLKDGAPLPTTLEFNPITGMVSGRLPDGTKELEISIKAVSADGSVRVLNVTIDTDNIKEKNPDMKYSGLKDGIKKQSFNLNDYGEHVMSIFGSSKAV